MKKSLLSFFIGLLISGYSLNAQESYPKGTPIGRIFADFKYSTNENYDYKGFGVSRAWVGYKYNVDKHFSAQIVLDIGFPISTENFSIKRYSHFRKALISYKYNNLTLTTGITDARAATMELKLWGKRYLASPFLLIYRFSNIADLGFIADYKISDAIKIDASILNGEGYSKVEGDNSLLYAFGITLTPIKGLNIRAYADTYKKDYTSKNTFSGTIGYLHKKFSLAAGYNYKTNFDWTDKHNTGGFTIFGGINLTKKLELFGRYDMLESVIPDGETDPWNLAKDGSLIVAGLQYKVIKQIKFSLNYQGWNPANSVADSWDFIQVNAEFRF